MSFFCSFSAWVGCNDETVYIPFILVFYNYKPECTFPVIFNHVIEGDTVISCPANHEKNTSYILLMFDVLVFLEYKNFP